MNVLAVDGSAFCGIDDCAGLDVPLREDHFHWPILSGPVRDIPATGETLDVVGARHVGHPGAWFALRESLAADPIRQVTASETRNDHAPEILQEEPERLRVRYPGFEVACGRGQPPYRFSVEIEYVGGEEGAYLRGELAQVVWELLLYFADEQRHEQDQLDSAEPNSHTSEPDCGSADGPTPL